MGRRPCPVSCKKINQPLRPAQGGFRLNNMKYSIFIQSLFMLYQQQTAAFFNTLV